MSQEIARIVEILEQIGTRVERITIPLPPSVNRCYRSYRGRTILSDHYRRWLADADASSMMSGKRLAPFAGPVIVSLLVRPCPGWRASRDMDNLLKPVQDWLVRAGILKNDNCRRVPASLSLYLSEQSATEAEIEVLLVQLPGEIPSPKRASGSATKRHSSSSRRDSKRYRYKSR